MVDSVPCPAFSYLTPELEVLLFSLPKSYSDLALPRLVLPIILSSSLRSTFIRTFIQRQTLTLSSSSQNEQSCNSLNLQQHISFIPRTLHWFFFFFFLSPTHHLNKYAYVTLYIFFPLIPISFVRFFGRTNNIDSCTGNQKLPLPFLYLLSSTYIVP